MLEYLLVSVVSLLAAVLTLLSGFGLGTILLGAFALLFPMPVAVAATAIVHLANNIFKLVLVGKWADRAIVLRFGVPAIAGAVLGAAALGALSGLPVLARYEIMGWAREVTIVKASIGLLILLFAMLDLVGALEGRVFPRRMMPLGGLLSGFFGGLSGHQGALRSVTLLKGDLDKERYIGTTSVCSMLVDVTRLVVYGAGVGFFSKDFGGVSQREIPLISVAIVCALVGSLVGKRLIRAITLEGVHRLVGIMLIAIGSALILGIV